MHATLGDLDKYPAVTQSRRMFYSRGEDIPKTDGGMMAVEAGRGGLEGQARSREPGIHLRDGSGSPGKER